MYILNSNGVNLNLERKGVDTDETKNILNSNGVNLNLLFFVESF